MKRKRKGARGRSHMLARIVPSMIDSWFGDEASFQAYRKAVELSTTTDPRMYHDSEDDEDGSQQDEEFGGDYSYMLSKHSNGVAVLQIYGSLVPKESWWNRYVGLVSYEEIRNAAIAAHDGGAKALLLDFDTGGGAVSGIGELSDFLSDFDNNVMPVYSYTGSNMLSAGYWLGSVGRKLYGSKMAMSGSIGVVTAHFSYYRAMEKAGVDVTMFRAGEFKALGSAYEQLDDKAKADIQARLNKFYDMFLSHVSDQRGIPVQELIKTAAEGRVFIGDEAQKVGLVDVITSFDKAVLAVGAEVASAQGSNPVTHQLTVAGQDDMKRKLNAAGMAAVAAGGITAEEALKDETLSEAVADDEGGEGGDDEGGEGGDDDEGDDDAANDGKPPITLTDASLIDKLMAASAKVATLEAKIASLEAQSADREANFKALLKIAADSTNRMELPLGRTQTQLNEASAEVVLNTYHSTLSAFNSKFKVGQVVETASDKDLGTKPEAKPTLPSATLSTI